MVIVDRQHRHCVKEKSDHRDYLMSFSKVREWPHCILKHVVISDNEQAPSQVDQARLNWERNTYNFTETIEGFKTYRILLLWEKMSRRTAISTVALAAKRIACGINDTKGLYDATKFIDWIKRYRAKELKSPKSWQYLIDDMVAFVKYLVYLNAQWSKNSANFYNQSYNFDEMVKFFKKKVQFPRLLYLLCSEPFLYNKNIRSKSCQANITLPGLRRSLL